MKFSLDPLPPKQVHATLVVDEGPQGLQVLQVLLDGDIKIKVYPNGKVYIYAVDLARALGIADNVEAVVLR